MYSFLISIVVLVLGYYIYGAIVDRIFGSEPSRETPAKRMGDGMDYVEFDWKRAFLVQFLNIAGTGPIFGAIAGALWGPAAFLWIVFGCIFAGAVHDFLIGMMSVREDGATIAEIVGKYLGKPAKIFMRFFSVILLLLVGVVFVVTPADILSNMTSIDKYTLIGCIIVYYMLATILPIDKLIGKIYPLFGASLLIMAVGIGIGIIIGGYTIPEISFHNFHPAGIAIFPFLFISIACGAISGFHATQAPMMARCLRNEREGRKVFYGAMISEGIVALIWAAAAMSFFGGTEGLAAAGGPGVVVSKISSELLGGFGGILAVLGVVACPITSGDTAFRSARLAIADAFSYTQKPIINRFIIAIPLFAIGIALCFINFSIIWRYFSWSNQTLATVALWAAAMYLVVEKKNYWIAVIPATFMTAVVTSYIITAKEGLNLGVSIGNPIGVVVACIALGIFIVSVRSKKEEHVVTEI